MIDEERIRELEDRVSKLERLYDVYSEKRRQEERDAYLNEILRQCIRYPYPTYPVPPLYGGSFWA